MLDSTSTARRTFTLVGALALLLGGCAQRKPPSAPAPSDEAAQDAQEPSPTPETLFEDAAEPSAKEPPAGETVTVTSAAPMVEHRRSSPARARQLQTSQLRAMGYIGDAEAGAAQPLNTESYDPAAEGRFLSPVDEPLSTFSIDVDTASYANARRFIESQHRLPPAGAVRIEEMLNYFSYDYPDPDGQHPFSVVTEVSEAPWNPDHRLVHIGLQGQRLDREQLPENNLVFLIDVSGSMQTLNKLPLLKRSFGLMVDQLDARDTVAIVVYAGSAGLVLPPTPGSDKATILASLEALEAGGSTAGGAGLSLAYDVASRNFIEGGNNRVVLATDGDFNVGASSDAELVRLVEAKRDAGIDLSVLGFGTGNYQDSKMERLAKHGNGNAAYIDSLLEAKKVLVTELGGTLVSIARDVKIQVEFNPAVVKGYRLIGYENRRLAAADFNDDTKDAGELGAGHSVTALYDVILASSDEPVPTAGELRYQRPSTASGGGELLTVKLRYKFPETKQSRLIESRVVNDAVSLDAASDDFRFSAAVAEIGLLLVDSKHRYDASWTSAIELARGAVAADEHGYRQDFIDLARKAELLARSSSGTGRN
ncbi:MAG: VWA domain-containing protein [Acidobacteriota bacterium]